MTKIIINVTDRKNKKHTIEGQKGQTLMQLVDQYELANPYGICGGEPMCGTCHVLKSAGSDGDIGPNLDQLNPSIDQPLRNNLIHIDYRIISHILKLLDYLYFSII